MVTPTNQVYCYHFNTIGSTIAITDQSQTMVNKYAYDPFGNIVNQVEALTQPFKFVGQYGVMTEPNGFYYMKARYYDPDGQVVIAPLLYFAGAKVAAMVIAYAGVKAAQGVANLASGGKVDNQAVNQAMNRAFAVSAAEIGTAGAIYGGVATAPAIGRAVYINAPQIGEFIQGYLPTGAPPPTPAGYAGLLIGRGVEAGLQYYNSMKPNYK